MGIRNHLRKNQFGTWLPMLCIVLLIGCGDPAPDTSTADPGSPNSTTTNSTTSKPVEKVPPASNETRSNQQAPTDQSSSDIAAQPESTVSNSETIPTADSLELDDQVVPKLSNPVPTPIDQELMEDSDSTIEESPSADEIGDYAQDEPEYTEEELKELKAQAEALEKLVNEIVHNSKPEDQRTAKQVGEREVWIDKENSQVIAGGKICLRHGPLEMFACPRGTKEHESVISVNALSSQIHFCLVLCGAVPGNPVTWNPEYKKADGPKIDIEIAWKDGDQIKRVRAQEMIRNMKTKEKMKTHWIFVGSQLYEDEAYYGDAGELLCLSNFSTATLDIPIESANNDAALLFEALTENIPEVNTQVFVYFKPDLEKPATQNEINAELKRLSKLNSLKGPPSKKPSSEKSKQESKEDGKTGGGQDTEFDLDLTPSS